MIVGQEVRTRDGDLIGAFLERDVPSGLPPAETIADIRAQGGLVGIPHPFDRFRGSLLADEVLAAVAPLVDWVETHNARIMVGKGNEQAAAFARAHELPGRRGLRRPLGDGDRGRLRRRSTAIRRRRRACSRRSAAPSSSPGGRRSSSGPSRRSRS